MPRDFRSPVQNSANGAASMPAFLFSGSPFTGGTAATTKPLFLFEPSGVASSGFSTNGTFFGFNVPSSFNGDIFWIGQNGTLRTALNAYGVWRTGLWATSLNVTSAALQSGQNIQIDPYNGIILSGWSGTGPNFGISFSGTGDCNLRRDGVGILSQRAGSQPQTYRLANYYSSGSDFELGTLGWSSAVFRLGTTKGGSGGTTRAIEISQEESIRIRWGRDGLQRYAQPAPTEVNATATLTAISILSRIITTTTATAVDMTLPTAASLEALGDMITDAAFEWSIINTGPGVATILANDGHAITGSASVAAGTSGRFLTRRASSASYTTFRI